VARGERLHLECNGLMAELDRDNNEAIGYEEFMAVLHREPYVAALPPGALRALLSRVVPGAAAGT